MRLNELLVVVPHSGLVVPDEILLDALSERFDQLARNVDWYTNWLYDFRDILDKGHVDEGHPVIVLVQAWADREMSLREWRNNWENGHYAVVIGYNPKAVFFEDPSAFYRTWLNDNEFLARWNDLDPHTGRKLEHFGMVLPGRDPVGKVIEHMD